MTATRYSRPSERLDPSSVRSLSFVERGDYFARVYICGKGHQIVGDSLFSNPRAALGGGGRYLNGEYVGPLPALACSACRDTK